MGKNATASFAPPSFLLRTPSTHPVFSSLPPCQAAIGSAAGAAGPEFAPFCAATLSALIPLMSLSAPSDLDVRARAYELVGIVGLAVGRQAVEALLPGFMEAGIKVRWCTGTLASKRTSTLGA